MESPFFSSEHNLCFRNKIEFDKQHQDLNYHFLVVAQINCYEHGTGHNCDEHSSEITHHTSLGFNWITLSFPNFIQWSVLNHLKPLFLLFFFTHLQLV